MTTHVERAKLKVAEWADKHRRAARRSSRKLFVLDHAAQPAGLVAALEMIVPLVIIHSPAVGRSARRALRVLQAGLHVIGHEL